MYQRRLKHIVIGLVVIIGLFVARLAYLQIYKHSFFTGESRKHRVVRKTLDTFRGSVYDAKDRVLAQDRHAFHVSVPYKYLFYKYLETSGEWPTYLSKIRKHQKRSQGCTTCHEDEER